MQLLSDRRDLHHGFCRGVQTSSVLSVVGNIYDDRHARFIFRKLGDQLAIEWRGSLSLYGGNPNPKS
jgi:dTDP-4-dehydrorhamnose 3,5-epimerase-like enzyme